MANLLLLVVGALILLLVVVDLLWTTLWADGGSGPITSRVSSALWRGIRVVGRPTVVSLAGPIILTATLLVWIGLLWTGWVLLFAGGDSSIEDASDRGGVSWPGLIYFVGYTMFTMGNGDFQPTSGVWQVLTGVMAGSGMLFVTLAVTYTLSVLGAVAQKRSFASSVRGFGTTGTDVVSSGWNGRDLHDLDPVLSNLTTQLSSLADKHGTYPVLHYYHSRSKRDASPLAVATLDDALTLMRFGLRDGERLYNATLVESCRSGIESYLDTLQGAFISPADRVPPSPDLDVLRARALPTVDDDTFATRLDDIEHRRRRVLGAVRSDAWGWPGT